MENNIIGEVYDSELYNDDFDYSKTDITEIRETARWIFPRKDWKIAVIQNTKRKTHTMLPWWHIDVWEESIEALKRELMEEINWVIKQITSSIGIIVEHRDRRWVIQISEWFIWKLDVDANEWEYEEGHSILYMTAKDAIKQIKTELWEEPIVWVTYWYDHARLRDIKFLEKYIEELKWEDNMKN